MQPARQIREVLEFWFALQPQRWFERDETLDQAIRQRFGPRHAELAAEVPAAWTGDENGYLAAIIVLDQFSRNIYRDDPRAFAADARALSLAEEAISAGLDVRLEPQRRHFLYLPFQHSESAAVQRRSVELFRALGNPQSLDYAVRHQAIIERFGRFPHRNAVLGRESTAEELAFLEEPGSSF